MPDTTLTSAVNELKEHQRQLDMDGVEVGVSRQALDIVLLSLARAGLEASTAEESMRERAAKKAAEVIRIATSTVPAGPFMDARLPAPDHLRTTLCAAIRALPLTTEGGDKP